jgi:hypothetical protein
MTISRLILRRIRNVSDKGSSGNQIAYFMFYNFFFWLKVLVFETISKNLVVPERSQEIWRMRVACAIGKATRAKAHACARAPALTPTHARTHAHTHTQRNI